MALPDITPEDVAAQFDDAKASESNCADASDWLAYLLKVRAFDVSALDDREQRDLMRAGCAYALHLAAGGAGRLIRITANASRQIKSVDVVGDVKTEFQSATAEQAAASAITAANDWLTQAYRYLRRAGLSLPVLIHGASR